AAPGHLHVPAGHPGGLCVARRQLTAVLKTSILRWEVARPTHFDWPLPYSAGWSARTSSVVDPGTGVKAIGLGGQFARRMGWHRHRIARGLGLRTFRAITSATG